MKIRIIEECYIAGKRAAVGSEHSVSDSDARNLVNLGRALPVVAKAVQPEAAAQPEPERRNKSKR